MRNLDGIRDLAKLPHECEKRGLEDLLLHRIVLRLQLFPLLVKHLPCLCKLPALKA